MKLRFSDRIGVTKPPSSIQVNSMNESLRNSIWNLLLEIFDNASLELFYTAFIKDFLKEPLDVPRGPLDSWFRKIYFQMNWFEVYNLLEFIAQDFLKAQKGRIVFNDSRYGPSQLPSSAEFEQRVNEVLERELAGYRFIHKQIVPISSEVEVSAIEEALEQSKQTGLQGAYTHLKTALEFLSKKPPDCRNSIKEAISAVESVAKYITGSKSQGLKGLLDELSSKVPIHGALREAFIKLYGYSSDEQGIRHALLSEPNVELEEAKFMLVSCSAFVGYLISKAEKANLIK
jgi:hypothetical protein